MNQAEQLDKRSTLKVQLPSELHRSVRMAALSRGESMRAYVEDVLTREVKRPPERDRS